MLSLAAFRYRNVLAEHGGPIASIQIADFPVYGRSLYTANARLTPGLVPERNFEVYSNADGTGAHTSAMVARHMAVSEALERWAFHATVRSPERHRFGFDADESSSGMAAFPGWSTKPARRAAELEAIERHCLINWWEGCLDGEVRKTPWPSVTALSFEPVRGVVSVILYARTAQGFYSYGHAAASTFEHACHRALLELSRHEWVLSCWRGLALGKGPKDCMERRACFFSSEEGHRLFLARIARKAWQRRAFDVVCDAEIPGPWQPYTTVWRYVIRPPSPRFMSREPDFFFW